MYDKGGGGRGGGDRGCDNDMKIEEDRSVRSSVSGMVPFLFFRRSG